MKSKMGSKRAFLKFLPKPDERMMIIGMTGSGKTFFAEKILNWRKYVVVYDLKGELNWTGYKIVRNFEELKREEHPKLIFKPPLDFITDEDSVNDFFHWVYERRNCTLYVDEVMTCCFRGRICFWLLAIVTRGRELGISFIGSTQRPKQIPISLLSEAERWAMFRVHIYDDAKRLEQTFGIDAELIQNLPKRRFYYGSVDHTYAKPFTLTE